MKELRLLARMWPHARPDAWVFVYALIATPLMAVVSLSQPWFIKRIIDDHVVPGQMEGLSSLALMYLGAVLIAYVLEATYTLAIAWGGQRTILRLRRALYTHALGLRQSFYDVQPAGKLLTRLTSDLDSLGDALGAGVVTIAMDLIMIVGTLAAMFWLDWRLTLLMLCMAPPLLLIIELLRRQLKRLYLDIREALARINADLAEQIDGVEVVQLFGAEADSKSRFEIRNREYRNLTSTSNVFDALMYAVVDGASSVFVAVMLAYGAGLTASVFGIGLPSVELVSVGLLVAFIEYLSRLFRPLRDASGKIAVIQRATAALEKIFGLFEGAEPAESGDIALDTVRGHLVLEDVHFSYREDGNDVLRGIDLEVKPGEVVAVVGATGSGKTTLARVIDKSYQGYRGQIRLDGEDLDQLETHAIRRRVASVRQDIQLFSETAGFNVDLGNRGIDLEEREQAAAVVKADAFITRLGWDHVLRERGADLSVGEGQLLTFARTMAHDPAVVILDEATASIDSLTEQRVQAAIGEIMTRKTVIVIAHRLSTVQAADRIVVMDHGRIIEQGTHDQLMAVGGAYAALVHAGEAAVSAVAGT